jgi:hypothetical protein
VQSTPHSTRPRNFNNPILLIELNLVHAIQDCDTHHSDASTGKRRVLCGVLADLTTLPSAFRLALFAALEKLKPPKVDLQLLVNKGVQCDIIRTSQGDEIGKDTKRMESEIGEMK